MRPSRLGQHALHGPQRLVPLALPPRAGGEAADERTREREHGEGDDAFGGRARRPVALDLAQDERPEGEHGPDRGHESAGDAEAEPGQQDGQEIEVAPRSRR